MPVALITNIPNMNAGLYKKLHNIVMGNGRPNGMISHCCHVKGTGVSIIDIWESKWDIDAFFKDHLVPAMERLEIDGEPEVLMITNLINANAFDYKGPFLSAQN